MIRREGYPEVNELVICTVKKVLSYCAFLKLDEYKGREGMLHISQIDYGRIRNIRDYVKPGKKVICKVTKIDKSKGHIDLSLKTVSQSEKRQKMQEYKKERRVHSFIKIMSKKLGMKKKKVKELEEKILEEFGSLSYFAKKALKDEKTLEEIGVPNEWADKFKEFVKEDLEKEKEVETSTDVRVQSTESDGVGRIKEFFKKLGSKKKKTSFEHLGSPKFRIKVEAKDYKKSEKKMSRLLEEAEGLAKKKGVRFKKVEE